MSPDNPRDPAARTARALAVRAFTVAAALLLLLIVWLARDALAPYLLAVLLIYMLLPIVHLIERFLPDRGRWRTIRRPLAAVSATVIVTGVFVVLVGFLLEPVLEQTSALLNNLETYWTTLLSSDTTLRDWYVANVPEQVQTWINDNIQEIGETLASGAVGIIEWLLHGTGNAVNTIVALFAIPLFTIYYLIDEPRMVARWRRQFPAAWSGDAIALFRIADRVLSSYTIGTVLEAVIVGAITGAGYWLIGVELALPLGVVAFAGEIVPIIGPWLAFFISFPVVLATQPELAIPAMLLFGVIQMLEGWLLAPRITGGAVAFTPAGTLIILAVGGALAGGLGVIFALPAAALLRETLLYSYFRLRGARPDTALSQLPLLKASEDDGPVDLTLPLDTIEPG
jgi:predicted PurR-regulated permease PerM